MPFHFRAAWFDTANRGRVYFPHFKILREYMRAVRQARIVVTDKARCYLQLLRWPWVNANWVRMLADLVAAVAPSTVPAMLRLSRRLGTTKKGPPGRYSRLPDRGGGAGQPPGDAGTPATEPAAKPSND